MRDRITPLVFSLLIVCILAVSSVTSAGLLAPDRNDAALAEATAIFGALPGDYCGTEGHHEHNCPYCNLLPTAPTTDLPSLTAVLTPHSAWQMLADLTRKAQARNPHHSARAPPHRI
ncbi:hypothetical protein Q4577_10355 [Marinovum sp. 2_MG-2023]|uniref:hypothetical protein n=1 Tax=unclassified Marinovum TaxID=2647166 RepID=UPI0026E316B0|nr:MULTISPECIES: hypothetical protein [unclassified Marinovum]MDO6730423.1 hypothetical protein [Marinovum sp. 2_MG-2023]MDO6778403.1 hypothetical protein [Marinovum sp. 1_MG-2023]